MIYRLIEGDEIGKNKLAFLIEQQYNNYQEEEQLKYIEIKIGKSPN